MHAKTASRLAEMERQELNRLQQDMAKLNAEFDHLNEMKEKASTNVRSLFEQRGQSVPFDIASQLFAGLSSKQEQIEIQLKQLAEARELFHEQLTSQLIVVKRWEKAAKTATQRDQAYIARIEEATINEMALTGYMMRKRG